LKTAALWSFAVLFKACFEGNLDFFYCVLVWGPQVGGHLVQNGDGNFHTDIPGGLCCSCRCQTGCGAADDMNPIQSNPMQKNRHGFVARIFNNITYKLKHFQFQLIQNEYYKQRLDHASVCLDDF